MGDFGKLNFSVSFNRTSAFPIEANGYFESLEAALTAAATAVEVGSAESTYYIGLTLTVVEGNASTTYIILPDKSLKEVGNGVGMVDESSDGTGEVFNDYTNNTAKGSYSHIEGWSDNKMSSSLVTKEDIYKDWYDKLRTNNRTDMFSTAFGKASHVEGITNIALGDSSHVEGDYNVAYGESAHAEGYRTKAFGICSHIEGGKMSGAPEPRAHGYGDHVEGSSCITVDSSTSHAEGAGNLVSGAYSHIEGAGLNYGADLPEIISVDSSTKSFILNGDFTSIDVSSLVFGVEKVIIPNAIVVINDKKYTVNNVELTSGNTKVTVDEDLNIILEDITYFAIYNKGYCIGNVSHVEGGGNRLIGNNSHAEGANNFVKGSLSHIEGLQNTINGDRNHVEGQANTVNGGLVNHVEGNQCTANGNVCHLEGQRTIANNNMEHAQGNFNKSNTGDTTDKKTRHSIGIGTSEDNRKNALEVMENGDHYIIGVGGYDGANPESSKTLLDVINSKLDLLSSGTNIKTINGQSILGNGNIEIKSGGEDLSDKLIDILVTAGIIIDTRSINADTIFNATKVLINNLQ